MQKQSLNDLYTQYAKGAIGRRDFEGLIYGHLVKNQAKLNFARWKHEEYGDYVSWLYPRIHSAIDSYRETGASFEVYMGTVMRLSAKEYRVRATTNSITEYAAWTARIPELYTREEPPAYTFDNEAEGTETAISQIAADYNRHKKNPRQLLILVLKCYCYVSEDFLDRIVPRIGIDRENLVKMIDKLRTIRAKRDDEIYNMRERIYCQFYRCIIYEKRLSYMPEGTPAAVRMKQRLEKARQRLEKMRKRLAGIRVDASNRQVAEVIGISKGTVDASLYNLKAKWNINADKSMLN